MSRFEMSLEKKSGLVQSCSLVSIRLACLNQILKWLNVLGHFFCEAFHFVCNYKHVSM